MKGGYFFNGRNSLNIEQGYKKTGHKPGRNVSDNKKTFGMNEGNNEIK